jgi:hypothetical protein
MDIINSATILTVERCIKFNDLDKYFQIIKTDIDEDIFNTSTNYGEWVKHSIGDWRVYPDIFNYFLNKMQLR